MQQVAILVAHGQHERQALIARLALVWYRYHNHGLIFVLKAWHGSHHHGNSRRWNSKPTR
jgi:hypothetical protein